MIVNKRFLGKIIFRIVLNWVRWVNRRGGNYTVFSALALFTQNPSKIPSELSIIKGVLRPGLLSDKYTVLDGTYEVPDTLMLAFKRKLSTSRDLDLRRWVQKL